MLSITRIAGLAAAIAALALSVGASSASAANVYVCQLNGAAGAIVPGVQSILTDVGDLNPLDTDSGVYQFDTSAGPVVVPTLCAVAGTGGVSVAAVRIQSSGTYTNTLCGTGAANSPVGQTAITQIDGRLPVPNGLFYGVSFVAGSGSLTGGYTSNGGGTLAGYLNITPDAIEGGGDCIANKVTKFIVTGGFVAAGG